MTHTRKQLCDILVTHGIELRSESKMSKRHLLNMYGTVFRGTIPPRVRELSHVSMEKLIKYAVLIQRMFRKNKKGIKFKTSNRVLIKQKYNIDVDVWVPPCEKEAVKYLRSIEIVKDNGDKYDYNTVNVGSFTNTTETSDFAKYGSGVTGYFKFVKWGCSLFAGLSLIHLPSMIINYFGTTIDNHNIFSSDKVSYGNVLNNTEFETPIFTLPIHKYFIWSDVTSIIFTSISIYYIIYYSQLESDMVSKQTITTDDFTVQITNIDPSVTKDDIRRHLRDVNIHDVVDIVLLYDIEGEIQQYRKKNSLTEKNNELTNKLNYHVRNDKTISSHVVSLIHRKFQVEYDIRNIRTNEFVKKQKKVIRVFVTFDTQISCHAFIKLYDKGFVYGVLANKHPRLNKKHITVKKGPEPSTIIWENISYTIYGRFLRQLCSGVLSGCILIMSTMVTVHIKKKQYSNYEDMECVIDTSEECTCERLGLAEQLQLDICSDYIRKWTNSQLTSIALSGVIVLLNQGYRIVTRILSNANKWASDSDDRVYVMTHLFTLGFINMMINTIYDFYGIGLFSMEWFVTNGYVIILTLMCTGMSDILSHVHVIIYNKLKHYLGVIYYTQKSLNGKYEKPVFTIENKYYNALLITCTCIIFISVIPVLAVVGFSILMLIYRTNKYMFCNRYAKPPRYNNHILRRTTYILQITMLIRMGVSIYLNDAGVHPSLVDKFIHGIYNPYENPVCLLSCIYVLPIIYSVIKTRNKYIPNDNPISYTKALKDGVLSGLKSYNPNYELYTTQSESMV
jgi:hypothetical protein